MASKADEELELKKSAEERRRAEAGLSPSSGGGGGKILAMIGQHKFLVAGGIAAVILLYLYLNNQTNSGSTANSAPNYSSGGYVPSDLAAALTSINTSLETIQQELGSGSNTGSPPGGGNPPPGGGTGGPNPVTLPQGTQIVFGGGGRVWYTTPGGQQQLFSGPGSTAGTFTGFCPGCIVQQGSLGSWWARMPGSSNWWNIIMGSGPSNPPGVNVNQASGGSLFRQPVSGGNPITPQLSGITHPSNNTFNNTNIVHGMPPQPVK